MASELIRAPRQVGMLAGERAWRDMLARDLVRDASLPHIHRSRAPLPISLPPHPALFALAPAPEEQVAHAKFNRGIPPEMVWIGSPLRVQW